MPDKAEPLQHLVRRAFAVSPVLDVEICVPLATALEWHPGLHGYPGLLRAAADAEATRRVRAEMHERRISDGRWRATFLGGDSVVVEAASA